MADTTKVLFQLSSIVRSQKMNSLTASSRWLYMVMYTENAGRETPFIMPYGMIQEVTGFSTATIRRATKELSDKGFLLIEHGGLEANLNIYRLLPQQMEFGFQEPIKTLLVSDKQWKKIKQLRVQLDGAGRPGKMNSKHSVLFYRLKQQKLLDTQGSCEVCRGSKRLLLHHRDYTNWACETIRDVILLCGRCHTFVHKTD